MLHFPVVEHQKGSRVSFSLPQKSYVKYVLYVSVRNLHKILFFHFQMTDHQIAAAAKQVAVPTAEVAVVAAVTIVAAAVVAVVQQAGQIGNRAVAEAAFLVTVNSRTVGSYRMVHGANNKVTRVAVGIRVHGTVARVRISGNMGAVMGRVVMDRIMGIRTTIMDNTKTGVDHRLVLEKKKK